MLCMGKSFVSYQPWILYSFLFLLFLYTDNLTGILLTSHPLKSLSSLLIVYLAMERKWTIFSCIISSNPNMCQYSSALLNSPFVLHFSKEVSQLNNGIAICFLSLTFRVCFTNVLNLTCHGLIPN